MSQKINVMNKGLLKKQILKQIDIVLKNDALN